MSFLKLAIMKRFDSVFTNGNKKVVISDGDMYFSYGEKEPVNLLTMDDWSNKDLIRLAKHWMR